MASVLVGSAIGKVSDTPRVNEKSSTKMVSFRMGFPEKVKDETVWTNLDVVVFGRVAEIVEQYVEKGSEVFVSGRIRQREYTDGEGNKRVSFQMTADQVQLGARPQGQSDEPKEKAKAAGKPASKPSPKPAPKDADDFPDDVPF